ncbi:hypothetical protein K457DRAFT_36992 [Linnemannia elongata AG-77]|uniref:Uncharacterized protein n=1 Tax=Linnemannia elongata AG-77 TaxID=1314771 RepID=A0A197JCQ1_9FUNG|nr:hypothetical protein K457DRAFT_36992 [Linnemannia elongata AG-77]
MSEQDDTNSGKGVNMGQKGYFGYLKHTLKYEGELLDPLDCTWAKWDVDLLGGYYDFIRQNISDDLSTDGYQLGVRLAQHIGHRLTPARTSIYLDGSPPDQKAKAHSERAINRHKTIKEIDVLLEKVKKNSEAGKWTAKTVVKSITKKLASIFRMSPDFTRTFLDGLRSVFSDVVICEGEADTHIAQSITKNPPMLLSLASISFGWQCRRIAIYWVIARSLFC